MKKLIGALLGTLMLVGCSSVDAQQVTPKDTSGNCYDPLVVYMVSRNDVDGQAWVSHAVTALSGQGYVIPDGQEVETVRGFADVCLINPDATFNKAASIYVNGVING